MSAAAAPGSVPQLLSFGDGATTITVGHTGRVVYSAEFTDTNLWRLDLSRHDSSPEDAGIPQSTLAEHMPAYSSDGTRVAFSSTRSGSEELWIANVDGTGLRQVTSMGGPVCSNPQWSPDDRVIVFDSAREGSNDLYLLYPDTLELRRLTQDPAAELEPYWSRDGRWIYFGSDRTGQFETWKMPRDGGTAVQSHARWRHRRTGIPRWPVSLRRQTSHPDHALADADRRRPGGADRQWVDLSQKLRCLACRHLSGRSRRPAQHDVDRFSRRSDGPAEDAGGDQQGLGVWSRPIT